MIPFHFDGSLVLLLLFGGHEELLASEGHRVYKGKPYKCRTMPHIGVNVKGYSPIVLCTHFGLFFHTTPT